MASKFGWESDFGAGWLDNLTTSITGSLKAGLSRNKRKIIFTSIIKIDKKSYFVEYFFVKR
ncbi:hypothetical protein SNE23_09135 [Bacillus sp. RA(2023)]|uniref:hypothetical protein n=1 Tax=Bacillus TaxID=1386 RepID=UPI0021162035|nr:MULTISPECIES: hypothetical protein [Bacillus]WPU76753.1 hypothetical protein SNE23_09135 [Bacillus sp. RA(2023)]